MSIIISKPKDVIIVQLQGSIFKFRWLSNKVYQDIYMRYCKFETEEKDGKITSKLNLLYPGKWLYNIVEAALIGWENIHDEDGKDIPFATEVIGDMDPQDVQKIAEGYIKQRGAVEKKKAKKKDETLKN